MREKLAHGESVYLLGLGPSLHNSGASLVHVDQADGINIISNNEEERYQGIKHYTDFPELSMSAVSQQLDALNLKPSDIHANLLNFDYLRLAANAVRHVVEELPRSLKLLSPKVTPWINIITITKMLQASRLVSRALNKRKLTPLIYMRHHDNHAYFSYAVSPFARSHKPTMIAVIDGNGDDGSISLYMAHNNHIELVYNNRSFFDSLGYMYAVLSSTQGGWPTLSSEGRYMGASAWGDNSRLTNPFYSRLRQLFYFDEGGRVYINRNMAAWQNSGEQNPYKKPLMDILGAPIPRDKMWNPDAVLNVDNIEHAPITKERVDKAAATQLVFEDALFHVIGNLIRKTKSAQLVLCGGTALNCIANMRLLDHFNNDWYDRNLGQSNTRLHLWVPPVPGDQGTVIGSAYQFAMRAGARPGNPLQHAFYCGNRATDAEVKQALNADSEISFRELGHGQASDLTRATDLMAYIVSHNGIIGIYQGAAETGPRALGHRSILANPANPKTREILNQHVKYRELIRPLAPMATLDAALKWFDLSEGASDAHYNAYNYMVLTAPARPIAYKTIPAVIHQDGTSRVQIVRQETDPICYNYLKAMGKYIGAEVSVNTSLNVGAPICQTVPQALETLKKAKGMHALFLISGDNKIYIAWHNIKDYPKDAGQQLNTWIKNWTKGSHTASN